MPATFDIVSECEDINIPYAALFTNPSGQSNWKVFPQTSNTGSHIHEKTRTPVLSLEETAAHTIAAVQSEQVDQDFSLPKMSLLSWQSDNRLKFKLSFPFIVQVDGVIQVRFVQFFSLDTGKVNKAKNFVIEFFCEGAVALLANKAPQYTEFSREGKRLCSAVIDQAFDFSEAKIPIIDIHVTVAWDVSTGVSNGFSYFANLFVEWTKFRVHGIPRLMTPQTRLALSDRQIQYCRAPKKKSNLVGKFFGGCFPSAKH